MDTLTTYAQYAAYVIAGLIVILNGLAPLIKSTWTGKIVSALTWFHDAVLGLLLPQHTATVKTDPPTTPPTTPPSA